MILHHSSSMGSGPGFYELSPDDIARAHQGKLIDFPSTITSSSSLALAPESHLERETMNFHEQQKKMKMSNCDMQTIGDKRMKGQQQRIFSNTKDNHYANVEPLSIIGEEVSVVHASGFEKINKSTNFNYEKKDNERNKVNKHGNNNRYSSNDEDSDDGEIQEIDLIATNKNDLMYIKLKHERATDAVNSFSDDDLSSTDNEQAKDKEFKDSSSEDKATIKAKAIIIKRNELKSKYDGSYNTKRIGKKKRRLSSYSDDDDDEENGEDDEDDDYNEDNDKVEEEDDDVNDDRDENFSDKELSSNEPEKRVSNEYLR